MPVLIEYLLKVSIALAVVFLFYQLLLRRLTFYNWNRGYLVAYSLLCFFIPFMNITDFMFRHELQQNNFVQIIPSFQQIQLVKQQEAFWNAGTIMLAVFAAGVFITGVRVLLQLISLKKIQTKATLLNSGEVKLYHINESIVPFSFHDAIYINKELHTEAEMQEIIRHEFVHVKQKHSIDILLAELLCMVLWFHPVAWLLRKAIRQNLEFIADHKVLEEGLDKKQYQYLLLKVVGNTNYSIAPNFNFSSLKNRIIMMNKMKSARVQILRFLFVLPLIAVLLLAFREVNKHEKSNEFIQQTALLNDTVPGSDIANINVTKNNDQKTVTITLKNGTTETYNLNNEKEKAAFEKKYGKLDKVVPPPPAPPLVIKSNDIETVDVTKENGKNTIQIRLKDGTIEKYDLDIKEQRVAVEKKYNLIATVPDATVEVVIAPVTPVHEVVELNEKGYYVTIADNHGECVVIVKDKKTKIIEALKLTDWTKNEASYEKKYGKIPPPPPPPPVSVPSSVSLAGTFLSPNVKLTGVKSTMAVVSEVNALSPVAVTAPVSPVSVESKLTIATSPLALIETKGKTISINTANADKAVYYIDGKEATSEEVEKLNPDFIESISVLKGDSAIKLYGEKGKNGVILIKTKK